MPYHIYPTKGDAEQKSRDDWETVLGRPKKPEDVTEFLYTIHEGLDGRTAVHVPDDLTTLGISEGMAQSVADNMQASMGGGLAGNGGGGGGPEIVEVLDEANWPKPIDTRGA